MANTRSERVNIMMKNFMDFHEKGFSIYEIAEQFQVSVRTVYNNLQEIADKNGVTRNELLQQVKSPYTRTKVRRIADKTDLEGLMSEFDKTSESMDTLINNLDAFIEKEEI